MSNVPEWCPVPGPITSLPLLMIAVLPGGRVSLMLSARTAETAALQGLLAWQSSNEMCLHLLFLANRLGFFFV